MDLTSPYRHITSKFVDELCELLHNGSHIALLGARRGGKSLVLSELEQRVKTFRDVDRPIVVRLDGKEFEYAGNSDLVDQIVAQLNLVDPGKIAEGTRLSATVVDILKATISYRPRPFWFVVRDVLGFTAPLARELLQAFQVCAEDDLLRPYIGVIVTGSADFIPLTYGELSPYRHAKKFLALGFDRHHAGLFFARRRMCQRGEGGPAPRAGFEDVPVGEYLTDNALNYIHEQTDGNPHLLQQIVITAGQFPQPPKIENLPKKWLQKEAVIFVEHFMKTHMPDDYYSRLTLREIERLPDAFDLLVNILEQGDGMVRERQVGIHPLEVAALIRRDKTGLASIACPLWREFLKDALSRRRVADVYARQHRWKEAWEHYGKLPKEQRDRSVSGETLFRLRDVQVDWEHSFVDRIVKGSDAVCRQFFAGAHYLLGFDVGGVFDRLEDQISPLHSSEVLLKEEPQFFPDADQRPVHAEPAGPIYWLDRRRLCLYSECDASVFSRTDVRPFLFLQRKGRGRTIDSAEQRELWRALGRFWDAYIRAEEIAHAQGLGSLREAHLKVIERLNSALVEDPFDMGSVVKVAADALVNIAGYYRVLVCLVDAKREWIQAVAGQCVDPHRDFNYETNFCLDSNKPIEECDIQPWVVRKGETCVIADAALPSQRNPRTQWENAKLLGMKAITIAPMKISDRVLGTIHFERKDRTIPSQGELDLFRILAGQFAVLFQQAQRLTLLQESVLRLGDKIRILNPRHQTLFLNEPAAEEFVDVAAGWQKTPLESQLYARSNEDTADLNALMDRVEAANAPVRHYHFAPGGTACEWRITPIDDFRIRLSKPFNDANGRIAYLERVHDVRDLYQLYESLQSWLRTPGLEATAGEILKFFRRQGYLWCRLYLKQRRPNGAEFLESYREFGLKKQNHQVAFRRREIKYPMDPSDPQPWHMITDVRGAAIYEHNPSIQRDVEEAENWNGFPRYWTRVIRDRSKLEKEGVRRWIEAPLLIGNECVGKLSLSVFEDLRAEQWELLKSAILGVAVAIEDARRAENDAQRAVEETWKMAAAQAVHQLVSKLSSVPSWLRYALDALPESPAQARSDIENALQGVEMAMAILRDFRRYASGQPFENMQLIPTSDLVQMLAHGIRAKHSSFEGIDVVPGAPEDLVAVDRNAMNEVFEVLADNTIQHGGLPMKTLRISVSAERIDDPAGALSPVGAGVCITYGNNGKKIARRDHARVFEDFYSTHKDGTGLGLSLARRLVRRQAGEMCLGAPLRRGICFEIYLPFAKARSSDE